MNEHVFPSEVTMNFRQEPLSRDDLQALLGPHQNIAPKPADAAEAEHPLPLIGASMRRSDSDGSSWIFEDPSICYLENPPAGVAYVRYNWRDQLKEIADRNNWPLSDDDLATVRNAMLFLTKKNFFFAMEGNQILDGSNEAFGLPDSAAVIASSDGEPFIAFWDGETPKGVVISRQSNNCNSPLYHHACLTCPVHLEGRCAGESRRFTRNGCQVYRQHILSKE